MFNRKSGFTLVEIMIIVAIIGLLASIAIPNLMRARVSANQSSAQSTLKAISNALEVYSAANSGQYPSNQTSLINATPPYIGVDYFSGVYGGYTFTINSMTNFDYLITAAPLSSNMGTTSYTISTGGILTEQ